MILLEFFDSNTHRCYPFAEVNDLPTDLIIDAQFVVTSNVVKDGVFISKVVATQDNVQFYVSCYVEGVMVDLGLLLTVPATLEPYTEQLFTLVNDQYKVIMQGSLTIGYFDTILNRTLRTSEDNSEIVYDLQNLGNIISQRVIPITEWCTGLVINNKLYTGNVTLSVGEGLELIENGEGGITLSAKGLTMPTGDTMTDEELIAELLKRIGPGVTSINGRTGNVIISAGTYSTNRPVGSSGGTDANHIQVTTSGNAILISNYADNPLYDANGSTGDALMAAIATLVANARALNDRAGAIEQHNYAMDNAVNLLGAQLAKVD